MKFSSGRILMFALTLFALTVNAFAQGGAKKTTLAELKKSTPPEAPSSAEVMRAKISKAKSYLVVKNYPAAIYELENIRKETNDPTVHRVLNVLLMHSYLEQSDYKKAQKFLTELNKNPKSTGDYFAVAGQVVSGAKTQLARYQALGLQVGDGLLHEEAVKDLDGMRKTLELIVTQTKAKGKAGKKAEVAVVLLEESSAARRDLARDDFDGKRWNDQVAEAREQIVAPRSRVFDAVEKPVNTPDLTLVAMKVEDPKTFEDLNAIDTSEGNTNVADKNASTEVALKAVEEDKAEVPVTKQPEKKAEIQNDSNTVAEKEQPKESADKKLMPSDRKVRVVGADAKSKKDPVKKENVEKPNVLSVDQVAVETKEDSSTLDIGSLRSYATRQVIPVYPQQARSMRIRGTVKVEVIIDEAGQVAEIGQASGPSLLKRAAKNAIRRWKFRPFERNGQPVKAAGYVSFNFNL